MRGSPLPMTTSVCIRRPSRSASHRSHRNCSTISPLGSDRSTPALVDAQKSHAIAHPTCDDTHPAARSGRCDGIKTHSTDDESSEFRVESSGYTGNPLGTRYSELGTEPG